MRVPSASFGKLSIGVKLVLLYTVAMTVTVSVAAAFVYAFVERRVNREATLLVEVQAAELAEVYRAALASDQASGEGARRAFRESAERMLRGMDPGLRTGVELVDAEGGVLLSAGSLQARSAPLPRSLLEGERPRLFRAVNLGDPYAYLSQAISLPGGAMQVVVYTERYAENVAAIRRAFLWALPLVLGLTGAAGWVLARHSLDPLARIIRKARGIGAADLAETLPRTGSGDELDQLAQTLNEMLSRIRGSMEQMRRFNTNAAHEIGSPLSVACSQIEVTLEKPRTVEEYREALQDVLARLRILSSGVDSMLRLARVEAGLDPAALLPVSLGPVLATVAEFFEPLARERGIDLSVGGNTDGVVLGDAQWLHQLFSNLLSNAIQITPPGGKVSLQGAVSEGWMRVSVRDSGRGISDLDHERIFERFQRGAADRSRPGSGLGLPIARQIARAHGGDIEIFSAPDSGTDFRVRLPLRAGKPA